MFRPAFVDIGYPQRPPVRTWAVVHLWPKDPLQPIVAVVMRGVSLADCRVNPGQAEFDKTVLFLIEIIQIHFPNTVSSDFRNADSVINHQLG
jgi:hypothetical protein